MAIAKATAPIVGLPGWRSRMCSLRAVTKEITRKNTSMSRTLMKIRLRGGVGVPVRMLWPDLKAMYGTKAPKIHRNQISTRSKCDKVSLLDDRNTNTVGRALFQYNLSSESSAQVSLTTSPIVDAFTPLTGDQGFGWDARLDLGLKGRVAERCLHQSLPQ